MAGGAFSGGTSVDDLPEPGGPFAGSRAAILQTFSEEVLARLIWPDDEGIMLVDGFPTRRRGGGALEADDIFFRTSVDAIYFYDLTNTVWVRQTSEAVVEFYQVLPTEPTTRADGTALVEGDMWYDTTNSRFNIYDGSSFLAVTGGSTVSVQGVEVTDPDFINNPDSRGVTWVVDGSNITAIANEDTSKQDTLTFDNEPLENSLNPVTSDGVFEGLGTKQDNLGVNVANPTENLSSVQINNVVYRVVGSTPVHAQLRTSIAFDPTSVSEPISGTNVVRGIVSARIDNGTVNDTINSVTINSVHSSFADDRVGTPEVIDAMSSRFPWNVQVGDAPQTVVFTIAYTVTYTIDGVSELHHFTDNVNFSIIAAAVPFWRGTLNQSQITALTSLDDASLNAVLTRVNSNFTSPYTSTYTGTVGPDDPNNPVPDVFAALVVQQDIAIQTLRSEGFLVSFSSQNDAGAERTFYVSEAPLSNGPHDVTWRT